MYTAFVVVPILAEGVRNALVKGDKHAGKRAEKRCPSGGVTQPVDDHLQQLVLVDLAPPSGPHEQGDQQGDLQRSQNDNYCESYQRVGGVRQWLSWTGSRAVSSAYSQESASQAEPGERSPKHGISESVEDPRHFACLMVGIAPATLGCERCDSAFSCSAFAVQIKASKLIRILRADHHHIASTSRSLLSMRLSAPTCVCQTLCSLTWTG